VRYWGTICISLVFFGEAFAGPLLGEPENQSSEMPSLFILEPLIAEEQTYSEDSRNFLDETNQIGFVALEKIQKDLFEDATEPAQRQAAIAELVKLYIANGLYIEARAVLKNLDLSIAPRLFSKLAAICDLQMGREIYVLELLDKESTDPEERALHAIALVRLGAYKSVLKSPIISISSLGVQTNKHYRSAIFEAAVLHDHGAIIDRVRGEIEEFRRDVESIDFLEAQLFEGNRQTARLRVLAKNGEKLSALRAQIQLIRSALKSGDVDVNILWRQVDALRLQWRRSVVEREILFVHAEVALATGNYSQTLKSFRQLIVEHPLADSAFEAQSRIMELLPTIASQNFESSPTLAAELVLEYAQFAPAGARGDEMIRDLAERLSNLELNAEAAKLLDHQVFERLRGATRSVVAADLAAIYLRDEKPEAALKTLRSTRIAGLSPEINNKRRALEAHALMELGKLESALALLSTPRSHDELRLRADIFWALEDWKNAAQEYASLFSSVSTPDSMTAVRAAIAYQLAGDEDGLAGFKQAVSVAIEGTPEIALINALDGIGTLGDEFMDAYQVAFNIADAQFLSN